MSHVLAETLARGETDFILCYDVPDLPQFSRIPILQDDLVLVTLAAASACVSRSRFAEVLDLELAMPEEGDTVRIAVAKAARDMKRELSHCLRGAIDLGDEEPGQPRRSGERAAVFFAVIDEVRDGKLDARQIVNPSIRRTLYLATSGSAGHSGTRTGWPAPSAPRCSIVTDALGPLAHPL